MQDQPMQQQGMGEGVGTEDQTNVSPEEQAQYDEFVTNGMQLIYNKDGIGQLLQAVAGDGNPIEGLAHAMVTIVTRLEDSARDQGKEISGDVKYHGSVELLEQVAELASAAGIHDFTEEEMESAMFMALDLYRAKREQDGTLPVGELQEDMNELVAADQQGRLEELLPGVSEYAQRAPQPEQLEAAMGGQEPPRRQ